MKVTNKHQMFRLLESGAFGNHVQLWRDDEGLLNDAEIDSLVGFRCVGRPGLPTFYSLLPGAAVWVARQARREYHCETVYSAMQPDHLLTVQGELVFSPGGPWFEYSTVKEPMRVALGQERKFAEGAQAIAILRRYAGEDGWQDLQEIEECFPGAVIELSCYSCAVGVIPGRQMIVWEVRHY